MSVVNKMLKDLEARQAQTDVTSADYQPPKKNSAKFWIVGLTIMLAVAISWIILGQKTFTQDSQLPPIETQAVTQKKRTPMQAKISSSDRKQLVNNEEGEDEQQNLSAEGKANQPQLTSEQTPHFAELPPADKQENTSDTSSDQITATKTKQPDEQRVLNKVEQPEKQSSFAMQSTSRENQAASLKQRISDSLENDDVAKASALLRELLASEPDNLAARKKLASLYFAQGNYQQSQFLLEQGIEQHPLQSDLKLMLARLFLAQKKPQDAMDLLSSFQPEQGLQIDYLTYRAALAQQLKQTALAKADYQKLTHIEPNNAKWWLGLAMAEDQSGNTAAALLAYQQAQDKETLDFSVQEFVQQRIVVLTEGQ